MVVKVMITMLVMSAVAVRGVDGGAAVDAGGGGGTVPRQELGGMPLSLSPTVSVSLFVCLHLCWPFYRNL